MSDKNASLVLGVQTKDALAGIQELKNAFDALKKDMATGFPTPTGGFKDLVKQVDTAAQGAKTKLKQAGEEAGSAFSSGFSVRLANGVSASFRQMSPDLLALVGQVGAKAGEMTATLAAAGLKSADQVKQAAKDAANAAKEALRSVKQGDLGLDLRGSAPIQLDNRLSSLLGKVNNDASIAEKARLRRWFESKDAETAAARTASEQLQANLDRIASDARAAKAARDSFNNALLQGNIKGSSRARDFLGVLTPEQQALYAQSGSYMRAWTQAIAENEGRTRSHNGVTAQARQLAKEHAEEQAKLHSTLRGVAGGLDNLWLTYGRYIPQMVAAYAVTSTFRKSLSDGMEFDYQTKFIETLGSTLPQAGMKAGLFSVGAESGRSVLELSSALRTLQQTGVDAAQGVGLLKTAVYASVLGETDMKTATEDLVGVLEVFNLHSKDQAEFSKNFERTGDILAKVSQNTKANLHQVAQSLQGVVGVAETYGVSLEKAAVVVERLGKAGIVGSRAGTYARGMIEALYAPISDRADKRFESLGITSFDKTKGEYKQLDQLLVELFGKLSKYSAKGRSDLIGDMFRTWDRKPLLQLMNDYDDLVTKFGNGEAAAKFKAQFNSAFDSASGLLKQQSEALQDNAKDQWKKLGADLANMLVSGFSGNETLFKGIAESLRGMVKELNFGPVLSQMLALVGYTAKLVIDLVALPPILGTIKYAMYGVGAMIAATIDGVNILSAGFVKVGAIILDVVTAPFLALQRAVAAVLRAVGASDMAAAIDRQADAVSNMTAEAHQYVSSVVRDFANGDSQLAKYRKSLEQTTSEQKKLTEAGEQAKKKTTYGTQEAPALRSGIGAQISAEKSAITELFRHREVMARRERELADYETDGLFKRKLISQKEFDDRRAESEAGYLAKVYLAETSAVLAVNALKGKADQESQRKQLDNEIQRIRNQTEERAQKGVDDAKKRRVDDTLNLAEATKTLGSERETLALKTTDLISKQDALRDAELVSSGDKANMEARQKAVDMYASAIGKATVAYEAYSKTQDVDTGKLREYRVALDQLIEARDKDANLLGDAARSLDSYHRSMAYGAKSAFAKYEDAATNAADHVRQVFDALHMSMTSQLADLMLKNDWTWRNISNAILRAAANIAASRIATQLLSGLASGFNYMMGSPAAAPSVTSDAFWSPSGTETASVTSDSFWAPKPSAFGNGFDGISRFAKGGAFTNAVVTSPTLFRFASGGKFNLGEMGEAGPEAVMPLARDSQGRLGVRSSGGGDGSVYNVNIVVNAESGDSKQSGNAPDQLKDLGKRLEAAVRGVIMEEKRPGGMLART